MHFAFVRCTPLLLLCTAPAFSVANQAPHFPTTETIDIITLLKLLTNINRLVKKKIKHFYLVIFKSPFILRILFEILKLPSIKNLNTIYHNQICPFKIQKIIPNFFLLFCCLKIKNLSYIFMSLSPHPNVNTSNLH